MSVLYFLLLIGVLVLIHELGHFAAAKLLDFKVTRFSFGFGRPLLRVVAGETEYQVGIFPLGGYVRIAGEDPEDRGGEPDPAGDDFGRTFDAKPMWQRLLVVFAGPLANLLLPIVIYFSLFVGHTELPAAVVGDVFDGSPAARAGVRSGDRIVAINGDDVRYWEDVERRVHDNPGAELKFKIERGGKTVERYIEPTRTERKGPDGRVREAGVIGITRAPFLPQVGVIDRESTAGRAGLITGDIVIAVEGRRIESDRRLESELRAAARSHRTHVSFLRGQATLPGISLLSAGSADLVMAADNADGDSETSMGFGLVPADLVVAHVVPESPAAELGLEAGDVILEIGGSPINHWVELERRLRIAETEPISVVWRRGGRAEPRQGLLTQRRIEVTDVFGHRSTELVMGARSRLALGTGETVAISDRFRYAAGKAIERTGETISVVGAAFWSIVRGRSPREELGGPITVYRAAAVSGQRGWISFLLIIALISISVALINVLPIPVLDGGHLLVFVIEAIRGERLSRRGHARFAVAGYAIVGAFTVLALGNDLLRYFLQ